MIRYKNLNIGVTPSALGEIANLSDHSANLKQIWFIIIVLTSLCYSFKMAKIELKPHFFPTIEDVGIKFFTNSALKA